MIRTERPHLDDRTDTATTTKGHTMTVTLATTDRRRRTTVLHRSALAAATAGLVVLGLGAAGTAGASTIDGTATVSSPGTTTALASGGSTTQFTVTLPAQASCDGDTATGGYHVYSYLVPKGTALSSVTFNSFPSTGYGLVDAIGTYYGPVNTAVTTGQIIGIPNDFEWGPLVTTDGGSVPLTTSSTPARAPRRRVCGRRAWRAPT